MEEALPKRSVHASDIVLRSASRGTHQTHRDGGISKRRVPLCQLRFSS